MIAIVGGGVYVPRLCVLLSQAIPGGGTLRLSARRADRLGAIAAYAGSRVERSWRVVAAASLEACVEGADVVVLLVRVGGLAARAHDERFPEAFGLVGDEGLGPGGFANGFRTAPVLAEMAATLRRCAPRALLCNMVAPLGMTTRLLVDAGLHAVGVCELPEVTLRAIAGGDTENVTFRYAGLNHVGWFWDVRRAGHDLIADSVTRRSVDADVYRRFGAAPLRYYYEVFDREAARRLGIERRSGRAQWLANVAEQALMGFQRDEADATTARPTPWFDDALLPLVTAHLARQPYEGFVNVANRKGLIRDLPLQAVVEVRARLVGGQAEAEAVTCPPAVATFLRTLAEAETLAYDAARAQDPMRWRKAVLALPLSIAPERLPALAALALAEPAPLEATT